MAYSLRKREKEFHKFFRDVPEDEILLRDYSCAYSKDMILYQGRLYMSVNWFCFHVNMLGPRHQVTIRFDEISSIAKQKTALFIPNAIEVTTNKRKYFFTTFNNRNHTFSDCLRIWRNAIQGKPCSQTELLVELSRKVALDPEAPLLKEHKKLSTSGDSSDPDVVTKEALCKDAVPHFALDVAANALLPGEATCGDKTGDHEGEQRAESEMDQDYTDACDSSDVLRQAPLLDSLSSPIHETASTPITTSDSGSRSDLVIETSSSMVEEKEEIPVQSFAGPDSPVVVTATKSKGSSAIMRVRKTLHCLLRPVALFNLLMIVLALILTITTATLMCHLSRVDQFINNMFPWQPWCSYICQNQFLMTPFDLSATERSSI